MSRLSIRGLLLTGSALAFSLGTALAEKWADTNPLFFGVPPGSIDRPAYHSDPYSQRVSRDFERTAAPPSFITSIVCSQAPTPAAADPITPLLICPPGNLDPLAPDIFPAPPQAVLRLQVAPPSATTTSNSLLP